MKKYKLIKEYPDSPELGTITEREIGALYPEFWQELKEPLFISEDNVEIFENTIVYSISTSNTYACWDDPITFFKVEKYYWDELNDGKLPEIKKANNKNFLYFSTEEAANKWVYDNKPIFSRKQILDSLESLGILEWFDEYDKKSFEKAFDIKIK